MCVLLMITLVLPRCIFLSRDLKFHMFMLHLHPWFTPNSRQASRFFDLMKPKSIHLPPCAKSRLLRVPCFNRLILILMREKVLLSTITVTFLTLPVPLSTSIPPWFGVEVILWFNVFRFIRIYSLYSGSLTLSTLWFPLCFWVLLCVSSSPWTKEAVTTCCSPCLS